MLPYLEAILAHLGAMFPISGTYVGSSCGYVCHIWDLCWVILRASVRASWSTFSAFDVGARRAPTKCRLCLSARRALPTGRSVGGSLSVSVCLCLCLCLCLSVCLSCCPVDCPKRAGVTARGLGPGKRHHLLPHQRGARRQKLTPKAPGNLLHHAFPPWYGRSQTKP